MSDELSPVDPPKPNSRGVDRRKLPKEARGPKLDNILPVTSGGSNYEFKLEPRCKVCQKGTEFLGMCNALLATGASYQDVLRTIDAVNRTYPPKLQVTYSSLRNHQKKHLPYDSYAIREIIEKRAGQQQKDFIAGTGTLLDPASYAEAMMIKGMQSLVHPATLVSPADGLAAAKTLYAITQNEEQDVNAVEAVGQLNRVIGAVRAVVPEEYWKAIVAYLNATEEGPIKAVEPAVTDVPVVDVPKIRDTDFDGFDPDGIVNDEKWGDDD